MFNNVLLKRNGIRSHLPSLISREKRSGVTTSFNRRNDQGSQFVAVRGGKGRKSDGCLNQSLEKGEKKNVQSFGLKQGPLSTLLEIKERRATIRGRRRAREKRGAANLIYGRQPKEEGFLCIIGRGKGGVIARPEIHLD